MNNLTDPQLVEAIKSGDSRRRDEAMYQFFGDNSLRKWTLHYVETHGGNPEDGEDIFQDAAVIFDRKIR